MDPIATLGLGATPEASAPSALQGLGGLDGDAFMNLLVTQLRYQDPLAPTDTNGLLQQTSMLAQTEMLTKVSQMQQQLLGLQRATMATDLIGAHVEGVDGSGDTVTGTVDAVRFVATGPVLVIGDRELALDDTTSIGAGAPVESTTSGGTTAHDPTTPTDHGSVGTTPNGTSTPGTAPSADGPGAPSPTVGATT